MDKPALPELDECKILILKIIEQSIRDYMSLQYSTAPIEQFYYQTAEAFIFDDEYTINYGTQEKTIRDLCDIVSVDIIWLRDKVRRFKEIRAREFSISGTIYGKYRR